MVALSLALIFASPVHAQTSASLTTLESYANLETAGAIATIAGDSDRDASVALEWRRVGDVSFRPAQPLLRIDATHFVGSLFGLSASGNYELRVTLSDPDGITGGASMTSVFATRADVLVEPTLRVLYVATNGNNINNGLTPATAVQSVQHAADLALAGDIVSVAPGIYREAVNVPRSGTSVQPIVFRGQGAGVILDGADAAIVAGVPWTAGGSGVYQRVPGFDTGHVATEQGRLYRYSSLATLQALASGAPGGYWFDGTNLYLKFSDGSAPAAHTIYAARLDAGFTLDGRANIRIENFEIRYYGSGDYGKGIYLRYSDDCIVRANVIHEIGSAGVWIKGGSRHRIEDNVMFDTSIPGWPWDQTKASSAENNAVVLTDDVGRGHVIRRNTISGWFNGIGPCGSAAPPGALTTEVDIYRNTFRYHNDDALEPEGYCSNVRIFENTVRDSHMAFAVAPAAPGPTWFVRNIAYDIGNTRTSQLDGYTSSGLKINSGYPDPVGPLLLYHNTFLTTAPATSSIVLLNPSVNTFVRARNNIFSGTLYVLDKVNPIAQDWDYDLLRSSDPTRFVKWLGTNYVNLGLLQSAQGQELHGVAATANIVAPASGDFRLRGDSAAIDHGVVLPGINDGYLGSAPDIGALEFSDRIFANGFE
jgi:Right handed beta helix region